MLEKETDEKRWRTCQKSDITGPWLVTRYKDTGTNDDSRVRAVNGLEGVCSLNFAT